MALVDQLYADPPRAHASGRYCFSLSQPALRWLEAELTPGLRTLETGCGASTTLFAAAGTDHTTISPDAFEHDAVRAWCAQRGIDASGVTFVAESSHTALPAVPGPLDLVLIDGAHGFPYPILDWFHAQRALAVGGRLLLDDAFIPTVGVVERYLRSSPDAWAAERVLGDRTPVFRKLRDDLPPFHDWGRVTTRVSFGYLPPRRRVPAATRSFVERRVPLGLKAVRTVGAMRRRRHARR